MTDFLFSDQPVSEPHTNNDPVIVVGLPRSGSSFLSHVLSQIPDWYVFDDLYLLEKADELRLTNAVKGEKTSKLLFFLGWQIRARLRHGLYAIPKVADEEVDRMNDAIGRMLSSHNMDAFALQKDWMIRLAQRNGSTHWGYKCPKAFRDLDTLRQHYPDMKTVFLLRQPHETLKSFKFMPTTSQDGHPDRYQALFYAIYWRLAARAAIKELKARPESTVLIKFDDLVKDTQTVGQALAGFLSADAPDHFDTPPKANTSFAADRSNDLTGLEVKLVNLICGSAIRQLGFAQRPTPQIKASDFVDFFSRTIRSLRFRATFNKR